MVYSKYLLFLHTLLKRIKNNSGLDTLVYGVPQLTATSLIDAAAVFKGIDKDLLMPR